MKGIEEFNRREFFQCHETLEDFWHRQSDAERDLTQGIIQIAVGYYHFLRDNRPGALKLLDRGTRRIQKYLPACWGIDVAALVEAVSRDREALSRAGTDEPVQLQFPQIRLVS
ncbi:MAG TPA: DUF309 domain-containing protein [Candidatus Obscuribacterales bacterium]